ANVGAGLSIMQTAFLRDQHPPRRLRIELDLRLSANIATESMRDRRFVDVGGDTLVNYKDTAKIIIAKAWNEQGFHAAPLRQRQKRVEPIPRATGDGSGRSDPA